MQKILVSHSEPHIVLHMQDDDVSSVRNTLEHFHIQYSYLSDIKEGFRILIDETTPSKDLNSAFKKYAKFITTDDSYKKFKSGALSFKLHCGVVETKVEGNMKLFPKKAFAEKMSYFVKAAINTNSYKNGVWDGRIKLYNGVKHTFPTGLLDMAVEILKENNMQCETVFEYDTRPKPQFDWKAKDLFQIADDQKEAIDKCLEAGRGVCKAPTGYGKTAVLARYLVAAHGVPTLFIANRKQLLDDAASDFISGIDGLSEGDIGQIKDGKFCDSNLSKGIIKPITQPIVIGTIQSLAARCKDPETGKVLLDWLHNTCKFVMVDETQAVGTKQWDTVLNEVLAPYRIFLSATPKRTDGATLKIFAASGPEIYTTTAEEQIEKGRLCELDINYIAFDHGLYNYQDKNIEYANAYEEFIMNNEKRNYECIIKPALEMIKEDRFVLVLIQRIDHGWMLKDLFIKYGLDPDDVRFIYGESASDARTMAIREFRKGTFKVLIGSTIFDAGVNIPLISGVILAGAGNSDITLIQRIGRGARTCDYEDILGYLPEFMRQNPNKVTKVYDVIDSHVKFFTAQSRHRFEIAQAEFGSSRVKIVNGDKTAFSSRRPLKRDASFEIEDDIAEQIKAAEEAFANFNMEEI